jgi:integrase
MAALREREGMGARALQFAILTAARSGEVRGARWSEIELDRAEWNIPAARMKTGETHRVPLSEAALAILREMAALKDGSGLVFIGQRKSVPMSDMTLTAVLRRMGKGDLTAHGFRSTFRDWAAEATAHPNHVVEQALAHAISSAVEGAYRRGDLIAKRRALMDDWAAYLAKPPAKVVRPRFGQQQAAQGAMA